MKVEVSRDNKNLGAHQHSLKTERIHQRKQRQEQDVTKNMEVIACVAWRFWLGALSNKGGRGQIGAGATWFLFFSRGFAARSRERAAKPREKNKNRLPGFVAFSTAAPFNSY